MTGEIDLIQWDYTDPADFKTYWPIEMSSESSRQRLVEWERYSWKTMGSTGTIFNTGWETNEVRVTSVPRTENLFVVQRVYTPNPLHIATFFVSFQALNAYTNLADVVTDTDGTSVVELIYEGRGLFSGNELKLTWVYLVNNDVFITF